MEIKEDMVLSIIHGHALHCARSRGFEVKGATHRYLQLAASKGTHRLYTKAACAGGPSFHPVDPGCSGDGPTHEARFKAKMDRDVLARQLSGELDTEAKKQKLLAG
jgi:hypothetical protein